MKIMIMIAVYAFLMRLLRGPLDLYIEMDQELSYPEKQQPAE
jgi:hypothetical protein